MHRMHRFLFHSERRKGMDSKQKGKGPKLERRNAAKNIDYEPASYPLSLQSDEPLERRTRSLDILPLCDRTSFRIEGNDGQFEDICRMLGLSGPEDFAIPPAAWEARTVRSSSDLLPRSRLQRLDGVKVDIPPPQPVDGGASEISERLESVGVNVLAHGQNEYVDSNDCCSTSCGHDVELSDMLRDSVRITDANHNQNDAAAVTSESRAVETSRRVGIRGARPPVLAPPPAFSRPVIDNAGSTWDIVRSFAPDGDRGSAFVIRGGFTYPDDAEADEGIATEVEVNRDRLEEIPVPSESCSFTTSNDDDSSSTTTDPLSNLSSTGRLRFTITRWQKGELLGRGSFGSVYEGIDDHGFFFAVKEVSLLDQGDQGRQSILQLEQEIALLSQFEHENIVQYYGTEKNDSKLYIFLELVTKGSLLSLYQKYNLRDSQVSAYTRQILRGLNYLHERDVVHRDIKCANILVDANGSVKLADFGLAKATKLNDVKSCKGTAFWMAPEVVKTEGYGLAADIWSLGCTVLEMLTRQLPYSHLECMQAIFRIGRGEPPPVPDSLSTDARDFIHTCLKVNPNARPTAAQLLDHPFVKRPLTSYASGTSPYHPGRRV